MRLSRLATEKRISFLCETFGDAEAVVMEMGCVLSSISAPGVWFGLG